MFIAPQGHYGQNKKCNFSSKIFSINFQTSEKITNSLFNADQEALSQRCKFHVHVHVYIFFTSNETELQLNT